jgi:hypothetical protein
MIIFGRTLQDKDDALPKEVADWLLEANKKYSNIQFKVQVFENNNISAEELEEIKKYSRIYAKERGVGRIMNVNVPFLKEHWSTKIIGLADKSGKIISPNDEKYNQGLALSQELGLKISGLADLEKDQISVMTGYIGLKRKEGQKIKERPNEFIYFKPDIRERGISLKAEQFGELMNDKNTIDRTVAAIKEGDREAVSDLLKEQENRKKLQ